MQKPEVVDEVIYFLQQGRFNRKKETSPEDPK
jgi:hypothetical protein